MLDILHNLRCNLEQSDLKKCAENIDALQNLMKQHKADSQRMRHISLPEQEA